MAKEMESTNYAGANHLKSYLDTCTSKISQVTRELDQLNANHLISDFESLETR